MDSKESPYYSFVNYMNNNQPSKLFNYNEQKHSPLLAPLKEDAERKGLKHSQSAPNLSRKSIDNNKYTYTQAKRLRSAFSIKKLVKADFEIYAKNNGLCPHKYHCIQNAIMKGFFRTFAAAFIFKTSLQFFSALFGGKIYNNKRGLNIDLIRKIYQSSDSMRFAEVIGLMSFTYKAILCSLRHIYKKDRIIYKTIAGFLCSVWIYFDDKNRQKTIALYCIFRAIGDLIKIFVMYKKLPKIKNFNVYAFTISQLFIMHGLVHAPDKLDPKYYKWIKHMGNLKEHNIQACIRSSKDPTRYYRDASYEPFVPCYPLFHKHKSCTKANIIDWFSGLGRAARMYIPVHFLPMLLFTPKRIINNPMSYVKRKSYNVLISSIFLTTYVFNMKNALCFLRNFYQSDRFIVGPLGGFMAGLSLLIEHPNRRPELTLYCLPRATELILKSINKVKYPNLIKLLRWKYLRVLVVQISFAIWMTVMALPDGIKCANTLNITVLKVVFGSKH